MSTKIIFIFALIVLQNFSLINPVYATEKYIEIDSIIAIVETQSITNLELNKKKEAISKALSQQGDVIPSDKQIIKLCWPNVWLCVS